MTEIKTSPSIRQDRDQNSWTQFYLAAMNFSWDSLLHLHLLYSLSPVADKIVLSSCSPIILSLCLWYLLPLCKIPSYHSQPIKLRTALHSIRIANATALNCGAQWNAERERECVWNGKRLHKNGSKKKYKHPCPFSIPPLELVIEPFPTGVAPCFFNSKNFKVHLFLCISKLGEHSSITKMQKSE